MQRDLIFLEKEKNQNHILGFDSQQKLWTAAKGHNYIHSYLREGTLLFWRQIKRGPKATHKMKKWGIMRLVIMAVCDFINFISLRINLKNPK